MSILEIAEVILSDKLERSHAECIDIRLTREQATALCETIHRIVTYAKNIKGNKDV